MVSLLIYRTQMVMRAASEGAEPVGCLSPPDCRIHIGLAMAVRTGAWELWAVWCELGFTYIGALHLAGCRAADGTNVRCLGISSLLGWHVGCGKTGVGEGGP